MNRFEERVKNRRLFNSIMIKERRKTVQSQWWVTTVVISLLPCTIVFFIELLLHPEVSFKNAFGHGELVMVATMINLSTAIRSIYAITEHKKVSLFSTVSSGIISLFFVAFFTIVKIHDPISTIVKVILTLACLGIAWVFSYFVEEQIKEAEDDIT